ncbi:MAG: bifunctional precorrin-2 dehydrogenase/sirohydrochlorin ferrochelatase [Cyclobacteriaceae bacterium]|nr:bifunctional precorrin-2 dehydrogenase/sirohydrochlorin ferrochelatase [Cyclobacteriaceae bacterium]
MEKNQLFPVFLKIRELNILLVGAGYAGAEKLSALLNNCPDASITVVADHISESVSKLAVQHWNVRLVQRKFIHSDLSERDLVFLATNDVRLHKKIVNETRKQKILTNVADTPDLCDFYLGSIVRKGNLKIGISTNGKSPTMAKRIREFLEDLIPENIDTLLENLHHFRNSIKGDFQKKVDTLNEFTRSFLEKNNNHDKIHQN